MNHDIAHCKGKACPIKKKCYRYLAYRELIDRKEDKGNFSIIEPAYNVINFSCFCDNYYKL